MSDEKSGVNKIIKRTRLLAMHGGSIAARRVLQNAGGMPKRRLGAKRPLGKK